MSYINGTRDHNLELLKESGFKRYKNTTVFHSADISLLSPAVSNSRGSYWIDIRLVNLERQQAKSFLLIRVVPNLFVLEPLKTLNKVVPEHLVKTKKNSGKVWELEVDINHNTMAARVFNKREPENGFESKVLTIEEVTQKLKGLVKHAV
ncbi:TPA: hypothetical protein ACRZ2J_004905 [Vibrio campbellii]